MSALRRLALGLYDFVVGEDWRTALGVGVALAVTAVIAERSAAAWLVMPVAIAGLLIASVRRGAVDAGEYADELAPGDRR